MLVSVQKVLLFGFPRLRVGYWLVVVNKEIVNKVQSLFLEVYIR